MFKLKYSILLISLCIVSIMGCDGKERASNSNAENLVNSNLSESFFVQEKYIPENYTEIEIDTILSSKLRVKIKYYSLLNKVVEFKSNNKTKYYRQFESQITFFKNDKILFKNVINISDFIDNNNLKFWNNAILQFVWLNEEETTEKEIQIYCSFLVPDTQEFKFYKIRFNQSGNRNIELIESS